VSAKATAGTRWDRLVRPSLLGLEPYRPGASISELKTLHELEEVVKLNWNEDLFGPFPGALEAVEAELANVWMYPEQAYSDFRAAVADWLGTSPGRIVPGHGVQSLVLTVAGAFLEPGADVVVPQPTYGLYAQVCAAHGARVHRVPLREHRVDLAGLLAAAHRTRARLVWVCDPNNPTGSAVGPREWREFLDELPAHCVAVVDEAYAEFVAPERRVRRERDVEAGRPVIVLRSFSKIFGLAGLRLGYAVVDEALAPYLDVLQEPFNVNRAALAAGRACLQRLELVEERRRAVAESRALLSRLLLESGVEPLPSEANFLLARVGVDDAELAEALARRGLLVRAGSEFGLAGWVRITVGPPPLMELLADELARARGELAPLA
jgi:histidinol-phosphate aminotransferase